MRGFQTKSCPSFPQAILNSFITNDFLKEGHAREIRQLLHCNNLSPWLTRDDAMLEVLQSVIAKHGKSVTAKHIAEMVAVANEMIAYAASVADGMSRRMVAARGHGVAAAAYSSR